MSSVACTMRGVFTSFGTILETDCFDVTNPSSAESTHSKISRTLSRWGSSTTATSAVVSASERSRRRSGRSIDRSGVVILSRWWWWQLPSSSSSSSYVTIGSLLGNFCCASLAARHPERIRAGILTNPWFDPTAATADDDETGPPATEPGGAPIPDPFELREDGSHLSDLHRKRSAFLDPDLNLRVVGTELSYLANRRVRYAKGVSIEGGSTYDFGAPCRAIAAATTTARETTTKNHDDGGGGGDGTSFLSIAGESCAGFFDRIGLDGTARFEAAEAMLREAVGVDDDDVVDDDGSSPARFERARLSGDGSTLNLINQMPDEFAAVCRSFLSARGL
mmetsp:Transcript_2283/g.6123  ORF Transcript_2283/g.6123 Transcript_2283/m.6123 type:complete len:336 (-) Transcript_2283:107-1114(-)